MNKEREIELRTGKCDELTRQEVKDGYRFCNDCDGMLININTNFCGANYCKELNQ
tara:strand:- start:279 stop:443 length:165 start_codon:yes stop_codon:yes gene_type:complete